MLISFKNTDINCRFKDIEKVSMYYRKASLLLSPLDFTIVYRRYLKGVEVTISSTGYDIGP